MRRSIISLVLGIFFAAAALFFLFSSKPQPAQTVSAPAMPTVGVMVAIKDIAYGDKIAPEVVKIVQWPAASVPEGAITKSTELFEGPNAPRIALRPMAKDEIFLRDKVSGFGERPILSRKVAAGMRAFSVRINDVSGVSGFILPGDRVDIMLTRQTDGYGAENMATDILLQNITVLGVNQEFSETIDEPQIAKSATFEVTPEQAQKLALATQVGTLSLSLRNYAALENEQVRQIGANDLGQQKPKAAAAPKAAPAAPKDTSVYVKVRKGTDAKSEKVAN